MGNFLEVQGGIILAQEKGLWLKKRIHVLFTKGEKGNSFQVLKGPQKKNEWCLVTAPLVDVG